MQFRQKILSLHQIIFVLTTQKLKQFQIINNKQYNKEIENRLTLKRKFKRIMSKRTHEQLIKEFSF